MSQSSRHARIASTLQGIVGRVLRIEPRDVDVEAPFLELGADSLALVEALRGLQEAYGVKLTIRQLFEQFPTIASLATFLEQSVPAEPVPPPPAPHPPAPSPAAGRGGEQAPAVPAVAVPPPPPVAPAPAAPPVTLTGGSGGSGMERVFGMQIQAFNQLVAQQLQMLGGRPVPPPSPHPPAPSPGAGRGGEERVEASAAPALKPVLPTYLGKAGKASGEMTDRQRRHLDELVARYCRKTAKSKEITQQYRPVLADSRATVGFRMPTKEMLYPIARYRSRGSRIWDVDGNEYVDVTMGMGVHLFGHDPEFLRDTLERQVREGFELGPRSAHSGEVAALFCGLTGMERATFTNSGTEACMTAIRLARARTGRSRIVMFAGSYHGHSDGTLAQTQEIEGELRSFPVAPGIPQKVADDVLVLDYGSPRALEVIRERRHELAAVFVEPIQSRRPEVQPREFLHELRKLTAESGIALIFDEMICGFRLHLGGAQAHFGVRADLATYGKVVGGGLPIGVVAGSAEYMDGIDGGMWRYGDDSRPERETTFFGGTFCQHPLAMAAARTVLTHLKEQGPGLQERLNATTARFAGRLNDYFESDGVPCRALHAHSLFRFAFSANADLFFYHLVDKGVYVWEWRNCFLSTAHTEADLDLVVRAVEESVAEMRRGGFLPDPPGGGGKKKPEPSALAFWGPREGKPAITPVRTEAAVSTQSADRDLRLGLYFFGHYAAEWSPDKYGLLFDAARFADRHGFASLWFPERHFHAFGGLSPNPSVLGAALARETERIALRAGSVVLPLHHPLRVAEEWALVDNLSGGRVGLSYASGWHPNDFALAPEAYGNHRELMFERIETVRRLWQGETVRVKDGAGSDVDLRIYPLPARRDLPIWITIVNNPDTYRRAGEIGAGVLTNLMGQTVDTLAASIRTYREALERAGHPPEAGHVAVLLHTFVGPDAAEAVETARRPFYRYLESSVGLLKTMIASEGLAVDFESLSPEDLEYMLGLAYQRYVATSALIGSPESCAAVVESLRAIGVDEIACLVDFGVERDAVVAGLPWLARLQDLARRPAVPKQSEPFDVPLTEPQEDLFAVVQMGETASIAYNEPGTLGLEGPLDLDLLRQALQTVVDRHESLRATLPPALDPIQRVLPAVALDVPLVDVSALAASRREAAASAWIAAEGGRAFDLAHGPLIRASVLRLAPRSHLLFLAAHHLVADGLSVVILLEELFAVYEAGRAGRRAALPPAFQFRQYAEWLAVEQADLAADEAYWIDLFTPLPPPFDPPTDRPRPPVRNFRGTREAAVYGAELRRAVQQLGRRRGATFFITLLAGWTALLHRWTGQDDVVVGIPLARRPLEGGDRLIGHCVDQTPVRSRSAGTLPFADHLAAIRGGVFSAHDHGAYPLARLVRVLNPPRDLSRAPLSNVTFNLDQDLAISRAGGLQITGRASGIQGVKFDLAVHVLERGEEAHLDAEYSTDLFDAATIRRLLGHFRTLLAGAAADPGRPLAELPLLDEAERAQLLTEWGEAPPPAGPVDFVAAVEAQAERTPEALAVRGCPGQSDLTYRELTKRSRRLAHHLRGLGAGPETRVAVCLERSPEMLVAVLGALAAGAAYVPLDPGYPADRLALMLAEAAPAVLVTRRSLAGLLPGGAAQIVWLEESLDDLPEIDEPLPPVPGECLAYVLYTSGSTGRPKGIGMSRASLANLLAWQRADLPEPRRTLQFASLSFDASFQEIFSTWTTGGTLVLISNADRRDAAELVRRIRAERVERLFVPFVALQQLAEISRDETGPPDSITEVLAAGETLRVTPALVELFRRISARLYNHYGPTEAHVVTSLRLPADPGEWAPLPSIGRPIAGCRAVVVDPEGRPVPVGVPGELLLGGRGVARGYVGRPDLTAERFVPDPFAAEPGARLYRTGDRARWRPDGTLELLGRIDTQVKIRGFRVEPGEVEAALAASGLAQSAEPAAAAPAGRTLLTDFLCALWAELLDREGVGEHDSFFDLGGHSLLATRMLARVRSAFGVDLPLRALFELPTVAGLAQRVDREVRWREGLGDAPVPLSPGDGGERRAPLSFAQERVWFFDRLVPGSAVYNLLEALRLAGPLRPAVLEAALAEVVRRHEVLRTVFAVGEDGEPVQVVRPAGETDLPLVDLASLPVEIAGAEARRLEQDAGRWRFDLAAGPLLRPLLVRRSADDHTLLLAVHHIVADGWSFGVLGSELAALYRAALAGEPSPLPPLPVQYADFAVWQRRSLGGDVLAALLDEGRRRLAGHPGVLNLPTDRPRPAEQSFRGAIEPLPLDPGLARAVRDLGRRHGVTPFMAVLAAYDVLLQRHTGQEDLLVGAPVANRTRSEIEGLVGFFVNTLVVRTDLSGDPPFAALLERVREATLAAYTHQDLPFEKLADALAPDRSLARNPVVQVAFAFQNVPRPARDFGGGVTTSLEDLDTRISKFDLTFFLEDAGDGLTGGVEYATDLFDAPTVRRFAGHFLHLLRAAVAQPEAAISELPILGDREREQVVREWNDTAADYPREAAVHRLVEAVAAQAPEAPAVLWDDESLSYGELNRRANRLARHLRFLGVGPEVPVVLDLERSPELVVAMLATLKAGGFYVPLDPADPEERRAFLLAEAGAPVRLGRDEVLAAWQDGPAQDLDVEVPATGLAYVIYTSGSTGRPKGVAVPHRAIVRLVVNTDYARLEPADRVAHVSNTAFDAATFEVWGALLTGAALVVIPRETVLVPAALGEEYRRRGITASFLTVALFNEVVREAPGTLSGLRHLMVGGEAVSPHWMREELATAGPEHRLLNVYGPTESTTFTTWHRVEAVPAGAASVPIGRPIANTRVYVVDRHLRPVPVGAPGELVIGGDGLARGYFRRPERTAERFIPNPFDPRGGRLYRTGDLVRFRSDGAVEFMGRTDNQVKIRGFRVEPGEIEAVLATAPGVRECAVLAEEDAERGRRLVAWVVIEGSEGEAPDLRAFLRQRLPEPMVPAAFGVLGAFPRTASGKVDRRALARQPLSVPSAPTETAFEAPRTPVEEIVAGAWAEVLGRERIGLGEDFFDLGGHSLLASRVLSRLRGALGVDLPLREFFRDPTVAGLARRIERARQERQGAVPPPITRVPRDRPLRLSFGQERLWLVDQLQPGVYNSFLPVALRGRLDVPALARVLAEIQRRHEVLRTHFVAGPKGPVQVIAPAASLAGWFLPVVDLSALPEPLQAAELRRLLAAELRRPFDLARGPLLRATLVRSGGREHALLLTLHHVVCDGWSLDVLTRETAALYRAFAAGRPSPLPELPVQYADFAHWQREWLQGEVLDEQLAWWRRLLGDDPAVLDLPTDRPRPAVPSSRGGARHLLLPVDLAAKLSALGRRQGGTLFITLLAGFQALLHRLSQQDRVSVGTPVANRTRIELEGLIGFFVNTLVLPADLSGGPTVRELLGQVRDVTLGAFDHQDLPFEKLVAALVRDRDPGRQPLFQAMFVLQNNQASEIALPDLTLAQLPSQEGTSPFDLVLSITELPEGLAANLTYAADLFDPPTIARLLAGFQLLLEGMAAEPDQPVSRLPLLTLEVRQAGPAEDGRRQAEAQAQAEHLEQVARLEQRRQSVSSRRRELSPERRALLQKWVGGGAKAAAPEVPAAGPLLALQAQGSRPPLFLVHSAKGGAHVYLDLAQCLRDLDPDQPLYAFEAPGLSGGELFPDLETQAVRYLEEVRKVQPHGPYHLGGWCTGGLAAFEMARQLRAAGEEVDLLVLIDSHAPAPGQDAPADAARLLAEMLADLGAAVRSLPLTLDDLRRVPAESRLAWALERAREHQVLPPGLSAEQAARHWGVVETNVRATESYLPAPLAVRAILFRAAEQPPEIAAGPALGWERWIAGPLEVEAIAGDHSAPLRDPEVARLARLLRQRLVPEAPAALVAEGV